MTVKSIVGIILLGVLNKVKIKIILAILILVPNKIQQG